MNTKKESWIMNDINFKTGEVVLQTGNVFMSENFKSILKKRR